LPDHRAGLPEVTRGTFATTEDVYGQLVFPDAEEQRLTIGRFLMDSDYDTVSRRAMLEGFDPYAHAGKIAMPMVHKHFMVRN
jgi:hypothetical protein